ncbi:apolipoprotein N-acyltransferase [Thermoflavifilum aggregans]|uniref:Apolipoprotein N-acyltransferase n=1 Tax=Thermoflavifilum aggregans TaxID=454188 RepID=A0A2M9CX12_9BACT|nr:BamA/TamA family outer membrane protein [Thermoflavifilum aggregans]PJJ76466.1 apolipoprotein N-acyltransferase [Thermoflavifilum aggregans]
MQKTISDKKINLLLICAIASLLLGRIFQLPFVLFLFPVFAIRYIRHKKTLPGFILLFSGSVAAILITFWGIAAHIFSSTAAFIAVMSVSTFVGLLPVLLDALLFKKSVNQLWLILVYPCTKVFLEFIGSNSSPFGIWGSPVSMLASWHPFNNLVAYGGIWTLSFLAALFSSILVYVLENGFTNNPLSKSLIRWYGLVILLVAIAGLIRIKSYQPGPKVRVAVVLDNDSLRSEPVNKLYQHLITQKQVALAPDDVTYYHHAFELSNLDVLQQTEKAAAAGAKIIFCGEGNLVVMKDDERALIDSVKKIAQKWKVYIGMAAEVYTPTAVKPVENKIIFIQPDGRIAFEYLKHYPLGLEKDLMVTGNGIIPTCNTPYGKVAAVICFDTDFITYARKAGTAQADILFAPSNDWKAIAELRGKITRYRALENGFTLIRPTSHGVTEMVTPTGQLIYANNYFDHPLRLMLADIPAKQFPTLYVQAGDWLPILILLILLAVMIGFWRKIKRQKRVLTYSIAIFLLVTSIPFFAQAQLADRDTTGTYKNQPTKKSKPILFPAVSYAPETSIALGVSAMHFYKTSTDARLSQIGANALYTFNRQFINEVNLLHFTPGNRFLVKAGLALNKFPEKFYGIGNKTVEENAVTISYNVVKTDISLLKEMKKNTYAGLHYNYSNFYRLYQDKDVPIVLDTLTGGSGNIQSGLGIEILHDSRDNVNNSSKGWYVLFDAIWNQHYFGSGTNYFAFDADVRKYHTLRSGAVLALQGIVNIKDGEVPFTQLSYLGGGNMMRGFYAGRFRDKDLVALQAEYRRHLWRNWGIVLFSGVGKVSPDLDQINGKDLKHSVGFGFRRLISKQHKVNLRMDVGFGNGQCNFYINIGEAF